MRNHILLFFIFSLAFCLPQSYAAFPASSESAAATSIVTKTKKQSFEELINTTIEKYRLPVPAASDAGDGGTLNIIAFALGAVGLVSLIAGLFLPGLGLLGLLCGIGAIVTGAIGKGKSENRDLGRAGFILGIIDVAIVLIALILAIVFIAMLF